MRGLTRGGRVGVILPEGAPGSVIATIAHSRGAPSSRRNTGTRGFRGRRATRGGISHIAARPQTSNLEHWVVAFRSARRVFYHYHLVIIILLPDDDDKKHDEHYETPQPNAPNLKFGVEPQYAKFHLEWHGDP